jgi:DNA repair protein RadC
MKKNIDGIEYLVDAAGILVPASLFVREGGKACNPAQVAALLSEERVMEQEVFTVITFDGGHNVIKKHMVTKGLANRSQVHPRETFRVAVQDGAVSIIVAHNHPSGSLDASPDDLIATRRLAEAGSILGIPLVDHLIVTAGGFVSLRESFPAYFNPVKKRDDT